MRRLTVKDVRWLNLETPSRPMHTLKIAVLQPPPGAGYEELIESARERVKLVPTLRWRLAFGPGRIGRPYWVEDETFDLDRHLVRKRIAAPGAGASSASSSRGPPRRRSSTARCRCGSSGSSRGSPTAGWRSSSASTMRSPTASRSPASSPAGSRPSSPSRWPPPGDAPSGLGFVARMLTTGSRDRIGATMRFARAARAASAAPAPAIPPTPFSGRALSTAADVRLRAAGARRRPPGAQGARGDASTTCSSR